VRQTLVWFSSGDTFTSSPADRLIAWAGSRLCRGSLAEARSQVTPSTPKS
jgi:hypothetical protein